jgi:hypothetical protein
MTLQMSIIEAVTKHRVAGFYLGLSADIRGPLRSRTFSTGLVKSQSTKLTSSD